MARRSWLLALLALALLAAPLAARAAHHGEDGDDDSKSSGKGGKDSDDDQVSDVSVKEDGTTFSLGSKWPITNGVLGCIDYDTDADACVECLEPYFTLNEDGVCDCAEGYGLAPFAYGAKAKKAKLMVCAPCPQGTWSDGGSYSTTLCERCATGSTTPTAISTSAADCSICQSGFAGEPDADVPCKLCAAGSYADPDNNAECTDCPEGFTTPKAGSTSEDQCYIAVCIAGEQSVKGQCYECADGWTSDKGNKFFGKYQPKCHKEGKAPYKKDTVLPRGKSWTDEDGHLADPKDKEHEVKVPDWDDDKVPKMKGIKTDSKHDDDGGDDEVVKKATA